MDYSHAAKIRNRGLLDLIAKKKFEEGQGLGASIGEAFSQKSKARMMGIKEAFHPMRMVRALTGSGAIGKSIRTVAGRAMGMSEDDIKYFGGFKRDARHNAPDKDPNFTTISGNSLEEPKAGDSTADIMEKLFTFMKSTREHDKLSRQVEESFRQEQIDEDDRRHKELVKAIKGFSGNKSYTIINNEKQPSLFDRLNEYLDPLLKFGKFIVSNPAVFSFLAYAIGAWLAKEYLDKTKFGERVSQGEGKLAQKAFREKQTDFSKLILTQDEAQAVLEQSDGPAKTRDIISFGGIERLQAIASGKPDPGGVSLQKPVDMNQPTNQTEEFKTKKEAVMPSKVKSKPRGTGSAAKLWEETFAKDYNEDGTRKSATPITNTETPKTATPEVKTAPKVQSTPVAPQSVPDVKSLPTVTPTPGVNQAPGTKIPAQLSNDTTLNSSQATSVAVNSTTNTVGGSAPTMVSADSTRMRDSNITKHLKPGIV